jgi:hypothetical protein
MALRPKTLSMILAVTLTFGWVRLNSQVMKANVDTSTASWEVTADFVQNTLAKNLWVPQILPPGLTDMGMRCNNAWSGNVLLNKENGLTQDVGNVSVCTSPKLLGGGMITTEMTFETITTTSLRLVDPTQITVAAKTDLTNIPYWEVDLVSASEAPLGMVKARNIQKYPQKLSTDEKIAMARTACVEQKNKKNCYETSNPSKAVAFYFRDQSTAKSFTRAILHAVVLSGGQPGTASSPF